MCREKERKLLLIYGIVGALAGSAFLITGIVFMIFGTTVIGVSFPNNESAPWGFLLAGILILLISTIPWLNSRIRTKEQEIEEKDERNNMLIHLSCCYAYGFLMVLGVLALLFLAMLGFLNKVTFFTMTGIFVLSWLVQMITLVFLNRKM